MKRLSCLVLLQCCAPIDMDSVWVVSQHHYTAYTALCGWRVNIITQPTQLCLGAKGSAPKQASGPIATLSAMAGNLCAASTTSPVVCIESEAGSVLIKSCDSLSVAVFKTM
ncbi:ragulator complex protein LAMTOR5-like isoform X1 [Haliotis asinina]|uniref:ragulator complex protein LAMTOR5-like isoform X1 n=1 Tax=Haliotis asinina TaxID=109174 RepID=UPI003531CA3D